MRPFLMTLMLLCLTAPLLAENEQRIFIRRPVGSPTDMDRYGHCSGAAIDRISSERSHFMGLSRPGASLSGKGRYTPSASGIGTPTPNAAGITRAVTELAARGRQTTSPAGEGLQTPNAAGIGPATPKAAGLLYTQAPLTAEGRVEVLSGSAKDHHVVSYLSGVERVKYEARDGVGRYTPSGSGIGSRTAPLSGVGRPAGSLRTAGYRSNYQPVGVNQSRAPLAGIDRPTQNFRGGYQTSLVRGSAIGEAHCR